MELQKRLVEVNVVAGVVLKQGGKYLLVQENRPGTKKHGLWNFPAGKVEDGDTIEQTAVKEAKEESGYEVELMREIDIFQKNVEEPPQHAFEARIVGGSLRWPKDEILDAKWFTIDEIRSMKEKLRGVWILGALEIVERGS